jgi:16S rRNA (uracil1498-N3)-methyltransferase
MNVILLFTSDFTAPDRVRLRDRRLAHIRQVHRAGVGDCLRVGLLDGALGQGRILTLSETEAELEVELTEPPPPKLPLTLVLALPRPKVLNRVVAGVTSLGVARLILVNAWRVEKAYWKSPRLQADNLLEQRILGLEQARDTVLPTLETRRFLRPFVEEELPSLSEGGLRLVAHPGPFPPCPRDVAGPVTLVVGPEGGFIPEEVSLLERVGFQPVDLGPRILRVETVLPALVGRLF